MQKFSGYRIKNRNIGALEAALMRAKENVCEAASEEYHRMLSEEAANVVDDIAMNIRPRPDCPIVDTAISMLNQRIMDAENFNSGTEYDLRAGVQIISDGDGYTYLILTVSNPLLEEAFATTTGIDDYTTPVEVDQLKGSESTKQSDKWESLNRRYDGESPMMSAALTSLVKYDKSFLRVIDKASRAATRARHHLTTLLLNRYACGKNIPNDQLMRVMDNALLRLSLDVEAIELTHITAELMGILPDYSIDDITRNPLQPSEHSYIEEPKQ